MRHSDFTKGLSYEVKDKGIKVIACKKYSDHIRKTYVIRHPGSVNGHVFYADESGALAQSYPISFNCNVFDPPILGEVIELELSLQDMYKWEEKTFK